VKSPLPDRLFLSGVYQGRLSLRYVKRWSTSDLRAHLLSKDLLPSERMMAEGELRLRARQTRHRIALAAILATLIVAGIGLLKLIR
jgi:hypothetical protein